MIEIYTDGGCSGNPGPGGWAFVIIAPEETGTEEQRLVARQLVAEKFGAEKSTTNNRMELQAVIEALEALALMNKTTQKVTVFTDSQYVQKGMTQWIKNWKSGGWKTGDKKPVKNQDLWIRLDTLASLFSITWTWVKGHAGNKYNELCDKLTQKAIASI